MTPRNAAQHLLPTLCYKMALLSSFTYIFHAVLEQGVSFLVWLRVRVVEHLSVCTHQDDVSLHRTHTVLSVSSHNKPLQCVDAYVAVKELTLLAKD